MLEYGKTDISKRVDFNYTKATKECYICRY